MINLPACVLPRFQWSEMNRIGLTNAVTVELLRLPIGVAPQIRKDVTNHCSYVSYET